MAQSNLNFLPPISTPEPRLACVHGRFVAYDCHAEKHYHFTMNFHNQVKHLVETEFNKVALSDYVHVSCAYSQNSEYRKTGNGSH